MRAMIALVKREYLEHRGAFVIGPAILIALLVAAALYWAFGADIGVGFGQGVANVRHFYERVFSIGAGLWLGYLIIMLFFYYGDAFSADSRDNAMLFWKSMPRSDLAILGTKVLASLTIFPAIILLAVAVTGLIAYVPAVALGNFLFGAAQLGLADTLVAWGHILLSAVALFAVALLWYLPFLAWVGLMSVIVKRWALPIAFLIPAVVGLFEGIVITGNLLQSGPIWTFLNDRFRLEFDGLDIELYWLSDAPWNGTEFIGLMLAGTDWVSLIGGLAVAGLLVFLASEYRRRYVLS